MKKFLAALSIALVALAGCSKYEYYSEDHELLNAQLVNLSYERGFRSALYTVKVTFKLDDGKVLYFSDHCMNIEHLKVGERLNILQTNITQKEKGDVERRFVKREVCY